MEFWDNDIPGLEKSDELERAGYVIQFGVPPNRIDLLNEIEGVSFEKAWRDRTKDSISFADEDIPVYFIGLDDLIRNKRQTGRNKVLEDLNYLENIM